MFWTYLLMQLCAAAMGLYIEFWFILTFWDPQDYFYPLAVQMYIWSCIAILSALVVFLGALLILHTVNAVLNRTTYEWIQIWRYPAAWWSFRLTWYIGHAMIPATLLLQATSSMSAIA